MGTAGAGICGDRQVHTRKCGAVYFVGYVGLYGAAFSPVGLCRIVWGCVLTSGTV